MTDGFVRMDADGRTVSVPAGMTLTAALLQAGIRSLGTNPVSGAERGAFCGMGICFECEVVVDGDPVRACLTPARDGMRIDTGLGA